MGAVYEAIHTTLDKPVALKVLPEDRFHRGPFVQRFRREMRAIGRLDHPNIVRATDAGEANRIHYLAMDLIDGLDLSTVSQRIGQLSVADACELIRQAAVGLEYVHQQGQVHRDIKPSNLMVTPKGEVKILDLGLALFSEANEELTRTGHAMGTVNYMAPEQASDSRRVDDRADVYSLGCTLYRLLTTRPPYSDERYSTPLQIMMAHTQEPVPKIDEYRNDVDGDLDRLLTQMLDKEPDRRPASGEVAQRLARFSEGANLPSIVAASTSTGEHAKNSDSSRTTDDHLTSAMTGTKPNPSTAVLSRAKGQRSRAPAAWQVGRLGCGS